MARKKETKVLNTETNSSTPRPRNGAYRPPPSTNPSNQKRRSRTPSSALSRRRSASQKTLTQIDFIERPQQATGQLELTYIDNVEETSSDKPKGRSGSRRTVAGKRKGKRDSTLTQMDFVKQEIPVVTDEELQYQDAGDGTIAVKEEEQDLQPVTGERRKPRTSLGKRKKAVKFAELDAEVESDNEEEYMPKRKKRVVGTVADQYKQSKSYPSQTTRKANSGLSISSPSKKISSVRPSPVARSPDSLHKNEQRVPPLQVAAPRTPQKQTVTIVPSSQSPASPLCFPDTPQLAVVSRSPLKEVVNLQQPSSPSPARQGGKYDIASKRMEGDSTSNSQLTNSKLNSGSLAKSLSAARSLRRGFIASSESPEPLFEDLESDEEVAVPATTEPERIPDSQEDSSTGYDRVISDSEDDAESISSSYSVPVPSTRVIKDSQADSTILSSKFGSQGVSEVADKKTTFTSSQLRSSPMPGTQRTVDTEIAAATQLQNEMNYAASSYFNYRPPVIDLPEPTVSQLRRPDGMTLADLLSTNRLVLPSSSPQRSEHAETPNPSSSAKRRLALPLSESQISTQSIFSSSNRMRTQATQHEATSFPIGDMFKDRTDPILAGNDKQTDILDAMQRTTTPHEPRYNSTPATASTVTPTKKQNHSWNTSSPPPPMPSSTSSAVVQFSLGGSSPDVRTRDGLSKRRFTASQLLTESLLESLPGPPAFWDDTQTDLVMQRTGSWDEDLS